jgi:hypothetical protein
VTRAALLLMLGACSSRREAAPEPAPPEVITARDPAGALIAELRVRADAPDRCAGETDRAIAITRLGADRVELRDGGGLVAQLAPGPGGLALADGEGAVVARVSRPAQPAGAIDLIDPIGVAIARIRPDGAAAAAFDRAGAPALRAEAAGGRLVVARPGGAAVAYVSGPAEPATALLLAVDALSPEQRALLACATLLPPEPRPTP